MDQEQKQLIIIDKALERYRTQAVLSVRRSMCVLCRDRRCQQGIACKAYVEQVRATAWGMVSHENN
jgi:hypothetical protein